MSENRGYLFLVTGLILGVLIGVALDRIVRPVPIGRDVPAMLLPEYKDEYRALIASAYLADGDLLRARERLKLLRDPDVYTALAEQAQRSLSAGRDPEEARALSQLAVALREDGQPGSLPSPTAAPLTGTPTAQALAPADSATDSAAGSATDSSSASDISAGDVSDELTVASATPTSIPTTLFVLEEQEWVCTRGSENPLIVVQVENAFGQPVAGKEIVVTWQGGEERFFTGLKPEFGQGYADYEMTPGIEYTLRLESGGQNITGLEVQDCSNIAGLPTWGMWQLKFVQH